MTLSTMSFFKVVNLERFLKPAGSRANYILHEYSHQCCVNAISVINKHLKFNVTGVFIFIL